MKKCIILIINIYDYTFIVLLSFLIYKIVFYYSFRFIIRFSYILNMRATLNNLGKKKQENTWGKNVDNSLLIVQKERGSVKKLIKLALKVGKHPLKFNESFSAKNIRTLNRS